MGRRKGELSKATRGKGMLGVTLRYPYEARKEEEYFDDIPDEKVTKDMLERVPFDRSHCMQCEPRGPRKTMMTIYVLTGVGLFIFLLMILSPLPIHL